MVLIPQGGKSFTRLRLHAQSIAPLQALQLVVNLKAPEDRQQIVKFMSRNTLCVQP